MKNLHIIIIVMLLCFGCKSPEARMPESVQSGSFLKESAERNKKLNEKEKNLIQSIIKNNPDKNYIASESGFWYYYNTKVESDTIQPEFGDILDFDYNISDINGNEIYDVENRTYVMDKQELFTGLREGLKLMKPEESVTFIFPSQKAYGYYGDDKKIGTNIPLICEVTLNTITQEND
ncbi:MULTISPECIES: gliding motility-associated peptidyl-prolyl isomerase GldI [Winogradskyella]|uniref:Peptidyl-prolyl cis-trans isomerase n=1 Tax=Winogradskyella ouciana TaxID=2608631 RepID=A0A7K1GGQ2_9FLAO|nr:MULTISPECIES: gliding motility-associated peptidyl-prolyl isomerase GldI [Winogradskyella]MBO6880434.1 gliding motility-associated peptidyl-prolyl isomerase GldI [Winogradskyella sp.]MTE27654.1 gliding motility-associated peptidyl-prolyl isomerase GldI [Winogradskyella ouciana]